MSYDKPVPPVDRISREYWAAAREGRLLLAQCDDCHQLMFYPRATCTRCLSTKLGWSEASGLGRVYSYTICYRAPDAVFRAEIPYVVALIDLDEGPRMMSNITGCDPALVRIGMPVQIWFEDATPDIAIPKFTSIGASI